MGELVAVEHFVNLALDDDAGKPVRVPAEEVDAGAVADRDLHLPGDRTVDFHESGHCLGGKGVAGEEPSQTLYDQHLALNEQAVAAGHQVGEQESLLVRLVHDGFPSAGRTGVVRVPECQMAAASGLIRYE